MITQPANSDAVWMHRLSTMSAQLSIDVRMARDDLYPLLGGGNKARKLHAIFNAPEYADCNAVVTCGGVQSNHARATALAAAQRGWRCRLVLHGDPRKLDRPTGNLMVMKMTGAEIEIVDADDINLRMDAALRTFADDGCRPCGIPGGGHLVHGAKAYFFAMRQLADNLEEIHWIPDWIILASGTGATQAGIHVAVETLPWPTKVVGISIARRNPRGFDIIEQSCRELREALGLAGETRPVDFRDEWVGEGYEKASSAVWKSIQTLAKCEGVLLDPTYTGKAFLAFLDLVAKGTIFRGAKAVFWHTGGLMNLMAAN